MNVRPAFWKSALGVCVAILLGGCGDGRPPMAPVTGRVTLDGDPIEDASVLFHSATDLGSRPGAGLTNAEGEFQITTFSPGDGGLIGTHKVTISKLINPMSPNAYELFPKHLADPKSTDLEAVVSEEGENRFEYAIVSDHVE